MVFDAKVFRHFSKIPIAYDGEDEVDDDADDETRNSLISPDDVAVYQPLYDNLVNHEKVKLMTSGILTNQTSQTNNSITKHIQRINSEVRNALHLSLVDLLSWLVTQILFPTAFHSGECL